jgi:hypothetical protein
VLARRASASVPAGALLGAASAVIAAHLAYRLRKRLPLPGAVGGVLEDGIVLTVCASHVSRELEERRP